MRVAEGDRNGKRRCLLVATVFPPVLGGSACVYENMARLGAGRITVLAPRIDYLTGREIAGWREFDAAAPFRVHRLSLLRTRLLRDPKLPARLLLKVQDVVLRARVILAVARIRAHENLGAVCIGELVAGGWLAGLCRRVFRLRTVIYVHGEEVSITDGYDFSGARRRATLAQADAVVAVSRFARDSLIRLMDVPPEKISLIPNGVDLARFTPRPRRADLVARYRLAGKRVLLTVGRLSERKGMDRVIQALPRLRATHPDLVYLLVGEGPFRAQLEAAASPCVENVVFAGAVPADELVDHYALADVFIMANRALANGDTEGFGLVFLEANACGIPVIAGRAGGSGDAVTHEVNGLVVDGDDPEVIAAALARLLGDAALRARLVGAGLAVAAQAGWEARAAMFLRVCDG